MNAISKARSMSSALVNGARRTGIRIKQSGGMIDRIAPTGLTGWDGFTEHAKNRDYYSMFTSWVYAAVNALSSEAGKQPVNIGRLKARIEEAEKRRPGGSKAHLLQRMTQTMRRKAEQSADVEVLASHPLTRTMDRPNPMQFRSQLVYSFVANLNLTGRAYIVRDETDEGPTFWCPPTTWVRPIHDEKKGPFSSFMVVNPRSGSFGTEAQKPLPAEQVAMAYLPNPSDPLGCISPASSQSAAIRVDDRIQTCQERFFDNAPFPSVIVTIGKDPHPDVPGGIRPRLTAQQRRQVTGAIKRVMGSVANYGNPAIVDGLIEAITPFTMNQREIGWERSEQTLKQRILSAFCVHPFLLGEPLGVGGYAQAFLIKERFCDRLNVFLDLLGLVMTELVQRTEGNEDVIVWWDEAKPSDPSMEWQNWHYARDKGDVTPNEHRAKLGLPPMEAIESAVLTSGAITGSVIQLMTAVGQGVIQPDSGKAILRAMGIAASQAEDIVGSPPPPPPQPSPMEQAVQQLGQAVAALREPLMLTVESIVEKMEGAE